MKKQYKILIVSLAILLVVVGLLIIKNINKKPVYNPDDVVDLGSITYDPYDLYIDEIWTFEEYQQNMSDLEVIGEYVDGELVEVIDLGDVGILGSSIKVDNAETDFTIDPEKLESSMAAGLEGALVDDPDNNEQPGDGELASGENSEGDTNPDATTPDNNNPDEPDPGTEDPMTYRAAVTEYVSADRSCQNLGYIVYAPENANSNTPIFLFLHGVGENGAGYDRFVGTFGFLKYLVTGSWKPNYIIVAPIMVGGSNWTSQSGSVQSLLGEVIANYGGNWDSLYVGGFSAGADAITPLAKSINFQGAIYMAGYMGGVNNSTDPYTLMSMWSGKNVFYFRDSLYKGGGYGYQADYINKVSEIASSYNVNFIQVDMNWGHYSAMADAAFLPGYFVDSQGKSCHDAISDLIY